MSGKHKKGTPSYERWIDSFRKTKLVKTANANLDARKPHKTPKEDMEKSGASFASMGSAVKTREWKMAQKEALKQGTGHDPSAARTGYGGVGGQGFGKALPDTGPSHDNVRNETLGMSPPGVEASGFIDKSVESDGSSSSSARFHSTQAELKKYLGSMPSVTAEQVRKKKGPAYGFEEDGAVSPTVSKSYNMDRIRLAWDLHQAVKRQPHLSLKKSDPVKGTITMHGIECCIEWPKGAVRRYKEDGVMKDGKLMKASYGYIPDTITADGEELDVYVGPNKSSKLVYLLLQRPTPWDISQNNLEPEEKYMIGFDSMREAQKAFCGSMPSRFFKNIREVSWEYFINRIKKANKKLLKHTQLESCGYLRKDTLDLYDRSTRKNRNPVVTRENSSACSSADADIYNVIKNLDRLAKKVNSIPRLVIRN
ncbi:Uncharacterised protein [uncultured archaeon]|nr:Uncharacterised protein [uncultured archaeon]